MKKLAIVTTHPIQYYAPLFRLLASIKDLEVKVFYTYEKEDEVFDEGFGKVFSWDIPLLEGYAYSFVPNNGNLKKNFWSIQNPTLITEIEQWGATAVLFFGWNFYSHLKAIKYFKNKIRVFFRGDSTLINQSKGIKNFLRKTFLTWVYSGINQAFYVGTANRKYYEFCGLQENKLQFAPHAIDNDRFKLVTNEHLEFVKKTHFNLSIQEKNIVILYCAKFQAVKNPIFFINAFKKIENTNLRLIMVGNGVLENELKYISSEDNRVSFISFQNQSMMPAVYRLGDLLVLPSLSETWGLAVNEAMACGKAVLVSNKCGCAEDLVENGLNGYVFESDNQTDLVNKINLLTNCKAKLTEMGNYSTKKINDWTFEKQVLAITQIL